MSVDNSLPDLLFLDTFSHDNSEDLNLDLVQFPQAIIVDEVRVIPLGTKVIADVPGGVRLGATNPSSFKLEFYVNNLKKPNSSTFEKLGLLEYKENEDIQLLTDIKVPTDGLIIKGWYQTITLAIYGLLTSVTTKESSPPPPPPNHLRSKLQSVLPAGHTETAETIQKSGQQLTEIQNVQEFSQINVLADNRTLISRPQNEKDLNMKDSSEQKKTLNELDSQYITNSELSNHTLKRKADSENDRLPFKSANIVLEENKIDSSNAFLNEIYSGTRDEMNQKIKENAALDLYATLSDGEIPDDDCDYSQASSDDNQDNFKDNLVQDTGELGEWESTEDGAWNYGTIASFNPYQCDLAPLETFTDPSLTDYELEKQRIPINKGYDQNDMPTSALQILKFFEAHKNTIHHEKWIEAMESLSKYLQAGLAYLLNQDEHKVILDLLIDWTMEGIDLERASNQPEPAYKIRHLKIGIKLAGYLCSTDPYVAKKLLCKDVQGKLLDLYVSSHMATSIKLLIINALDQTLRFKEGYDYMLGRYAFCRDDDVQTKKNKELEEDSKKECSPNKREIVKELIEKDGLELKYEEKTIYQRIVEILLIKQNSQPLMGIIAVMRKLHLYEVLLKLNETTNSLTTNVISLESHKSTQISKEIEDDMDIDKPNVDIAPSLKGVGDVCQDLIIEGGEKNIKKEILLDERKMEVYEKNMQQIDLVIEKNISVILLCLEEVSKVLKDADYLIGQPRRTLPLTTRYDIIKKQADPMPGLYRLFNSCQFLECMFVLLSCPASGINPAIFSKLKEILTTLMLTHSGLLFLSFRVETINGILRTLVQNDFSQDEDRDISPANQLGLTLVYYLQTMQHIDQLREYHIKSTVEKELDSSNVLAVLHNLYSITFTQQGRDSLVDVFCMKNNISSFMPFLEKTDDQPQLRAQNSVCFVYSIATLLVIARHCECVEWLEEYGHRIYTVTETEIKNDKIDERLKELNSWLLPMKQIISFSFEPSTIQQLVAALRQGLDESTELTKEIVTILRILKHLSVEPKHKGEGEKIELLKYKLVLTELFGANCLSLFSNILQRVKEKLLLAWQQGFPQSLSERSLTLSIVQPILLMMRAILSYLILARETEFEDLTSLQSLFGIHTVLCSISHTGFLAPEIQKIQNLIVDILLAFTQPQLAITSSDDALHKSLWSQMIKEVLKYTLTSPYTFLSGFVLLSEMLPLPLPIQSRESLSAVEIDEMIVNRKRWSAHIHPHYNLLQTIIKNLAGTNCQALIQLLRRVNWQFADLSAPAALTIIRSLLDSFFESYVSSNSNINQTTTALVDQSNESGNAQATSQVHLDMSVSGQTSRILNLLAFLLTQTSVKAAFLYLFVSGLKTDEKYREVLNRLSEMLNVVADTPSHIQAQESIVSIYQSLCDYELSLIRIESYSTPLDQLGNTLPGCENLSHICISLVQHIGNRDQKFSSVLPALRTLTLLLDHNYGFYYVKQAMEKEPTAFFNLFMQINATFSKDSCDCIATLSSAVQCIQYMIFITGSNITLNSNSQSPIEDDNCEKKENQISCDINTLNLKTEKIESNDEKRKCNSKLNDGVGKVTKEPDSILATRTYTLSYNELRQMIGWTPTHPIIELDQLLCDYAKDEETLKSVYESVNGLVNILKIEEEVDKRDITEVILPPAQSLSNQFNGRSVYQLVDEEDDRLTTAYWLVTSLQDETEHDQELIPCNFIQMSSQYCAGFDLEAELKKGTTLSDSSSVGAKQKKKFLATRKNTDMINTSKMRGSANAFVAPLRGRGFNMRGGLHQSRGGDVFRSRQPNTSRPPSMHVDDFVKMEVQQPLPIIQHQQQMAMNVPRRVDDIIKGHGFDRSGRFISQANKWRFYTPPTNNLGFIHREDPTGMIRPGVHSGYRGMIRGSATGGHPGIVRGSPSKIIASPWTRTTTRNLYGMTPFARGDVEAMQEPIERLDGRRRVETVGSTSSGAYFIHTDPATGMTWTEQKDRDIQPEQRFMRPPADSFQFWRERLHQRTTR